MTTRSLRILLDGLIDYAGLFPPAALTMQDAVRNYARYRESEDAWILGRFVVPGDRVEEVPAEFPLSVLWTGAVQPADLVEVPEGEGRRGPFVFEAKAATQDEVGRLATSAGGATVFVETTDPELLLPIHQHGLRAKIRTGGIKASAFPTVESVTAFIRTCVELGLPFKATAGLHHPLRCVKPLTYEPEAPTGTMHGFLNVFLAAALPAYADELLRETDPAAFSFDDEGAIWRDHRASLDDLRAMRRIAHSFGSCSFEEPLEDLRAMGWM